MDGTHVAGEPRPTLSPGASEEITRLRASGVDPVFPLVGADLVRKGIAPGRAIGRGLAEARAEWLAAGCPEDEGTRASLLETATAVARATAGKQA